MPANRLEEMFGSSGEKERNPSVRQLELEALLPDYVARLTRKALNMKYLHEYYRGDHPNGSHHASFGVYIQCYRLVSRPEDHVEHYAADQMTLSLKERICSLPVHPEQAKLYCYSHLVSVL